MFFDWKIQLEKVQLTRDSKDDTIIYQGIRLILQERPRILRSYYTNTSKKIVWFPEDTCTTSQVAK